MPLKDLLADPDSRGHWRPPSRSQGCRTSRLPSGAGQRPREKVPFAFLKSGLKRLNFQGKSLGLSLCSSRWGSEEVAGLGLGPSEASFTHVHDCHMEPKLLAWNIYTWPFHVTWASAQPSSRVPRVSIRQGDSQAPKYCFHHTLFIEVMSQGKENTAPAKQGMQQSPRKTHERPEPWLQPHGEKITPTALMSHQCSLWLASKLPHFRGLFASSDQQFSSKYRLKNVSHLWGSRGQIMTAQWAPVKLKSSCNLNRVSEHLTQLLWECANGTNVKSQDSNFKLQCDPWESLSEVAVYVHSGCYSKKPETGQLTQWKFIFS